MARRARLPQEGSEQEGWERRLPEKGITHTQQSPHAGLGSVAPTAVSLEDGLLAQRRQATVGVGLPALLERLEAHGAIENFRRVRAGSDEERRGLWFTDSDVYKWVEAAAWAQDPSADPVIETIVDAQEPDGYVNTYWHRARFTELRGSHELYCGGHLMQAAVAHHRTTGSDRLLGSALRFADLLCAEFGPGRREGVDHHPGVEMALVELYRETGESRYLDLAGRFLDRYDGEWRTTPELFGHAVRAAYWCAGMADWVAETGDPDGREALDRMWSSAVESKAYVTGGLGGRWAGESVGRAYELPNEGAYSETCAAIALAMWAWRMLSLTGDAQYADWLERALFNGVLAGVSLGGDRWFYANPLANAERSEQFPWLFDFTSMTLRDMVPWRRRPWFDCTCCPPNVARLLASVPGYLYGTRGRDVWVHLYAASSLRLPHVDLAMRTRYPWDGRVEIEMQSGDEREWSLFLRIPAWCASATVDVAGARWPGAPVPGSYLEIHRTWRAGDRVVLDLDLAPFLVECNPRVTENRGRVAIQRGPVVYCLEGVDHGGADVLDFALDSDAALVASDEPDLLGGVVTVTASGSRTTEPWGQLYRRRGATPAGPREPVPLVAIPYYAWANRDPSAMAVWIPVDTPSGGES